MRKIWLAGLFVLLCSFAVHAESVGLNWNANLESDLAGYKMYYGNSSGSYAGIVDIGNQTSYTIENLTVGQPYYIAVTAYDTSNNESDYSNEVSYTVTDTTAPGNPVNLKIIIIVQ